MRHCLSLRVSSFTILAFLALLCGPASGSAATTCTFAPTTVLPVKVAGAIAEIRFSDDCKHIYASNRTMNRVEVYAVDTGTFETPIQVGSGPTGIDIAPDGVTLYAANSSSSFVSIVDLARGVETGRIFIPADTGNNLAYQVAVARNNAVLVATKSSCCTSGLIYQYTPATKALKFITNERPAMLRASGDRGVIVAVPPSSAEVNYYDAGTDAYTRRGFSASFTISAASLDTTGSTILAGAYLLNSKGTVLATLSDARTTSRAQTAVSPDGSVGYQAATDTIRLFDLKTYQPKESFSVPGVLGPVGAIAPTSPIVLSADGNLLAVVTPTGFSLLSAKTALPPPSLHTVVMSSAQPNAQSFLRFYNAGTTAGTVKVTLLDPSTAAPLGTWTSPSIPRNTAPQFAVSAMEAAMDPALPKPESYVAAIDVQGMKGTMAHVLWRPADGTITNLSTCDGSTAAVATRAVNVHSKRVAAGYPSSIVITNTSTIARTLVISVSDAGTGANLGIYATNTIPANGAQTIPVAAMEQQMRLNPGPSVYHYTLTTSDTAYLQHLVDNQAAGVTTDLSTVCTLP